MALLSIDGLQFILRWLHVFFGIVWIGHLYYFNFVQGEFFKETDASTKNNAIKSLVPRALWWFRWGAMWTMATGLVLFGMMGHMGGAAIFASSWGVTIMTGMLLGLTMWYNVWFVIWPNQKIVIASATKVLSGGQADPAAAAAGARALMASRTNVLFSMPMLFFMLAARHLPLQVDESSQLGLLAGITLAIWAVLELNALKGTKLGPLTKISGVVHMGVLLTVVLYVLQEVLC